MSPLPFGITLPTGVRALDPAEVAILTPVFGSSLDYSAIRVSDAVGSAGRAYTVWVPLRGTVINIGPAAYATPGADPALLVHEATHSWQSQHHPASGAYMANSLASQAAAAAAGGSPYCYLPGKPFWAYGAEQIAKQVEHGVPAIVAHVRGVPAGSWDSENVRSLSIPRWEKPNAPGVVC
ncbi:hypothetical protein [Jatrophihabitans sp.]|uniref:hypothetical protein n=1 Tax=Jatrophihabitans sp. TaxID=1932789 RepID=UPI002CFF1074|nr:hypothetical protein [Jatrophihabitans sp.]